MVQAGRDDLACNAISHRDIAAHIQPQPSVGPLGGAGPPRIDNHESRPFSHRLQHVVEKDGMRFPGVRTPKDDEVCLLNFLIGTCTTAHSEDCRQTDDTRGVSSAVAAVDVVAAHYAASKLLTCKVELVGCL